MSPSERAAEDVQRIKAKWAKFYYVPGPGTYEPKFQVTTALNFAGSTSFRSKTDREKTPPSSAQNRQTSDPGQYNVEMNQIAAKSKASFQVSSKAGKSSFGSNVPRETQLSATEVINKDGPTPSPDAYNIDRVPVNAKAAMATITDSENMPMSAFKSTTRKYAPTPQKDQPGPGTYNPNDAAITAQLPGANMKSNPMSRTGRDSTVGGADVDALAAGATSALVGPGAYENEHRSIGTEARKKFERMSRKASSTAAETRDGIGFNQRQPARDLPFEKPIKKHASNQPGPGSFNPEASKEVAAEAKQTFNTKMKAGTSGFASGTKLAKLEGANRKDGRNLEFESLGDPGAYNPNPTSGLAVDAKKTFQVTYKSGKGAFGSTPNSLTKRVLKLDILGADQKGEGTPGPDVYNIDKVPVNAKAAMATITDSENMPMSAFKSTTQKYAPTPQGDQPGPGQYNPNDDAITPALPGANMNANPMSRTGRDTLAMCDPMANQPTEVIVGPGTYFPTTTNDGELNSIDIRATVKAERGWGFAYMSDTIREMWTGFAR